MGIARELAELGSAYNSGGINQFRNRIINGAMVIDQRNAGASVTIAGGSNIYTLDRWFAFGSQGSKFSVQQNAGSVTPPAGFTNYLGVTSLSSYSVGTNEAFTINQCIEGYNVADLAWGTANAQTITASFKVRSSLTGTFGGVIRISGTATYPFSYTISSANTWTDISITIPGYTGTMSNSTTNSAGIFIRFGLGAGSGSSGTAGSWTTASPDPVSATGAVSVVGTNGATFYITGVQLEKGSTATSFDYRPYGTELALCQRYCQVYSSVDSNYTSFGIAVAYDSSGARLPIPLRVPMRVVPSLTVSSASHFLIERDSGGAWASNFVALVPNSSRDTAQIVLGAAVGLPAGGVGFNIYSNNTTSARIILGAEL